MKPYGDIDSKFRFVIVSSKRAKQLLKGAKPKLKSKSKNLILIAQEEVRKGMVEFEINPSRSEDVIETEDDIFIGEELGLDVENVKDELTLEAEEIEAAAKEEPETQSTSKPAKKKK